MSWIQTVIIILVIVGPAISQIYQKVKEKQEVQRLNKRREAMKYEALRTGKPIEEESDEYERPQGGEAQKMAALERDRQARLAALRDQARQRALAKQAQMQQKRAPTAGQPSVAPTPAPSASSMDEQIARRRDEAQKARQQAALERQREKQRRLDQQRQRRQRELQRQQRSTKRPPAPAPASDSGSIQGLTESQRRHRKEEALARQRRQAQRAQAEMDRVSGEHIALWLRDKSALKRAIVMSEVLSKPLALR
ncbi:MAG: hypothetical protein ACF8GE_09550 [Phycisphaerales bacterium JB043]